MQHAALATGGSGGRSVGSAGLAALAQMLGRLRGWQCAVSISAFDQTMKGS